MNLHPWYDCTWSILHIRDGKVIWETAKKNSLTNAGERSILNTYFKNSEAPTTFYIRLSAGYIGVDDTLASIKGEPTGSGYSAQQVERSSTGFPKLELIDGDYRLVSKTVSFSATGQWSPVNYLFLATTSGNSGILIAGLSLETEKVLLSGDILQVAFKIRLR